MSSSDRATCWSVTINNPIPADEEQIALARQKGWKVEGQLETGSEGTPHYQLAVRTPQVRFSALKKAFPRAHIEVARNPTALSNYVQKEQTRTGELPASQDRYPSLKRFWEMVVDILTHENAVNINFTGPRYDRPDSVWWKDAPKSWVADPLKALDYASALLIEDGYFVEGIACNPSTRMAWRKFHPHLIFRALADKDRQTDTCVQEPAEEVSEIDIPNADDSPRT